MAEVETAPPPAEKLEQLDSFQYPAAHLGHLTDGQQTALDNFKKLIEEKGYYRSEGKDGIFYPSHDDETLLRYLRARKFSSAEAFKQFKDTEDWRKENRLDEFYEEIDITEYEECRRLYPQWTGRRDRRGIPVYLFEVAHLDSKAIAAYQASLDKNKPNKKPSKLSSITSSSKNSGSKQAAPIEPKMLRLFALYENLTRFVLPLCSAIKDRPHPETPISQSNNIVDISNVGLKQFWNLKSHMQDASLLATAHYPETLDRIFIIGAPSFFPTVWSWIKRWFDPITVSKIFILSAADIKPVLEKYIPRENIPKKYGGTLDFEFGMMPVLEPAISAALAWPVSSWSPAASTSTPTPGPAFPIGPICWRDGAGAPAGAKAGAETETAAGGGADAAATTLSTAQLPATSITPDVPLSAVAVGSRKDGSRREEVVATAKQPRGFREGWHGAAHPKNVPVDWDTEVVGLEDGRATQVGVDVGKEEEGEEGRDGGEEVEEKKVEDVRAQVEGLKVAAA